MKKLLVVAIIAVSSVSAFAWRCEFRSSTGYGIGVNPYINVAKRIAYNGCAAHTSLYDLCYDMGCSMY